MIDAFQSTDILDEEIKITMVDQHGNDEMGEDIRGISERLSPVSGKNFISRARWEKENSFQCCDTISKSNSGWPLLELW